MELLNLTPYLLAIDRMVEPIEFDKLTAEEQVLTKLLHTILRSCLEGRARSIYKLVDRANGFEAWRLLEEHYDVRSRGRRHERHMKLQSYAGDPKKNAMENLEDFDREVVLYENRFEKTIDEDSKISVALRLAPQSRRACGNTCT